jgi:hypothetical protein
MRNVQLAQLYVSGHCCHHFVQVVVRDDIDLCIFVGEFGPTFRLPDWVVSINLEQLRCDLGLNLDAGKHFGFSFGWEKRVHL